MMDFIRVSVKPRSWKGRFRHLKPAEHHSNLAPTLKARLLPSLIFIPLQPLGQCLGKQFLLSVGDDLLDAALK